MSIPVAPYDRDQVVARALASTRNTPGTCQLWTRTIVGAPSAGDYDGDGAADAEDGWRSEPAAHKHPGDRRPPAGTVVSYLGGSHDNGHRAVSLGPVGGVWMIRSTDAGGSGVVATVPLDWPERAWELTYAGWSDTCDGWLIPKPPPAPPKPLTADERAAVVRRQARRADARGHEGWAARLRAWARRITGRS